MALRLRRQPIVKTSLFALLLLAPAMGCYDHSRATKCEGLEIHYCSYSTDGPFDGPCHWARTETCPVACIEAKNHAFCALSKNPSPVCPPDEDHDSVVIQSDSYRKRHCNAELIVSCHDGYETARSSCAVFCVDTPEDHETAMCALEPAPNPLCGSDQEGECIDGEYVICAKGYVIGKQSCGVEEAPIGQGDR